MHRLTITNQKGGVGKTAISVDFARYASGKKYQKKVLFLDLDVQHNGSDALDNVTIPVPFTAYDFLTKSIIENFNYRDYENSNLLLAKADFKLADLEKLDIVNLIETGDKNIQALSNFIDLIVIDTPPTLGMTLTVALSLSYGVLVPIEPELSSITGAINVTNTLNSLKEKLKVDEINLLGFVINKMQNKPRQIKNVEQIRSNPILKKMLLSQTIANRDAIAESLTEHCDVRTIKKTAARKAVKELNALGDYLMHEIFKV